MLPSALPVESGDDLLLVASQLQRYWAYGETARGSAPLEARRAFFDERPDAFPGIFGLMAHILCERFKFEGSAQSHVLVVIQRPLGQADGNRWPHGDFLCQFVCRWHELLWRHELVEKPQCIWLIGADHRAGK